MPNRKAEFYWAIVGEANPEPVAVTVKNGKRVAYTIGCPDPFVLDEPDSVIMLLSEETVHFELVPMDPLEIPPVATAESVAKARKAHERMIARDRRNGIHHGWQRWNP